MANVYGNVKHPPAQERWIPDSQNMAWDSLGQKTVDGVVWHRIVGTLNGTDTFFRGFANAQQTRVGGLTEYGVGNGPTDGAGLDGVIYVWNDVTGKAHPGCSPNRAPWASGPVASPYGDGLAFITDHNWDLNAVNRNQAAIEISGNYDTPVSAKAAEAVCHLTAYYADQAHIPWESFPEIPGKGYSFVRWHQEFTIGTGKVCPGNVVIDQTATMIARVASILKQAQTTDVVEPPPIYAAADIPDWVANDLELGRPLDHKLGSTTAYGCLRQYTAIRETRRSRYADTGAVVGPPIKKGETFFGWWVFTSGGKGWLLTPHGTRIAAADCTPTIAVKAA